MKKKHLKEVLKQEVESEASALERRVNTKKSLASLEMPEDSYDKLMEKIGGKKEQGIKSKKKFSDKIISFCTGRKALATAAMIVILVAVTGLGVHGARLYILGVEQREKGSFNIATEAEDVFYVELTEREAYEKIEEEIGILALRLMDKPKEMELRETFIDAELGEALMEFQCDDHILTIYENKQNSNVSFNAQQDGAIVDTIETFHLGETLDITEVDKGNGEFFYTVQLEYGNAFYYLSSDIELERLKAILNGMTFNNI